MTMEELVNSVQPVTTVHQAPTMANTPSTRRRLPVQMDSHVWQDLLAPVGLALTTKIAQQEPRFIAVMVST